MSPFQVFCEYLALKSHFSNFKYDYFKYNKKVRATENSFKKRKDIYWFQKISRKYKDEEIVNFLLSNFVASDNANGLWIGEIINSGEKIYTDWRKKQESLKYNFQQESQELFDIYKLDEVFDCSKSHPILLKRFMGKKLSIETIVIYDIIFDYVKDFNKKLLDPVWEVVSLKVTKYKPFLNIDLFQYKKILRSILNVPDSQNNSR